LHLLAETPEAAFLCMHFGADAGQRATAAACTAAKTGTSFGTNAGTSTDAKARAVTDARAVHPIVTDKRHKAESHCCFSQNRNFIHTKHPLRDRLSCIQRKLPASPTFQQGNMGLNFCPAFFFKVSLSYRCAKIIRLKIIAVSHVRTSCDQMPNNLMMACAKYVRPSCSHVCRYPNPIPNCGLYPIENICRQFNPALKNSPTWFLSNAPNFSNPLKVRRCASFVLDIDEGSAKPLIACKDGLSGFQDAGAHEVSALCIVYCTWHAA